MSFKINARIFWILLVGSMFLAAGCQPLTGLWRMPGDAALVRLSPARYPVFDDDLDYDGLFHAIAQSLSYLQRLPAERRLAFGNDFYPAGHVIRSLERFQEFIARRPSAEALNAFIRSEFYVYQSVGSDLKGRVLYTGYYEPLLLGSRFPSREFPVPVYGRPRDLVAVDLSRFGAKFKGERIIARLVPPEVGNSDGEGSWEILPYPDRAEIEEPGMLDGRVEPLAWVADAVDLFFLQIQGSGRIYLDCGEVLNVHYHISNGRPYRSIGKYLIQAGKIEPAKMSMQAIRAYLKDHPAQMREILHYNPSYVFFETVAEGPLGCLEVRLTPGRAVALDRRHFPAAALAFVQSEKPLLDGDGEIREWKSFSRFMLNQDTGGAIKGPGRADIFWGDGPYAQVAAGHLQHPGRLFFLVLKGGATDDGSP